MIMILGFMSLLGTILVMDREEIKFNDKERMEREKRLREWMEG